jgi:hypothetical protein
VQRLLFRRPYWQDGFGTRDANVVYEQAWRVDPSPSGATAYRLAPLRAGDARGAAVFVRLQRRF